jgi:glutathione S-transferase
MASTPVMEWHELEASAPLRTQREETLGRIHGPTNAQAVLRLFGQPESAVRVTLYRDHHAWCPYCQKVWLWLEERQIPYRIRKVTMVCYGEKESWYRHRVPSGMLPALELDGRLITESDRILEELEQAFGPLQRSMGDPEVLALRRLERLLFRAWCQWLCYPHASPADDQGARQGFQRWAETMEEALTACGGPFLLGEFSTADLVFVPYLERMNASLAYYKGFLLREAHPAIDAWFRALEQRSTYRGTQGDFHTHAHDLPPQMGGCHPNGSARQQLLARRIDHGPWPLALADGADPESSAAEPADAALLALARVLRHRGTLLQRPPLLDQAMETALRCALTHLITQMACPPPPGTAPGLRYLRDRISVPRDMPLHAARRLRQALEDTALLDPRDPQAQGPALPQRHRRDQDPRPFLTSPPSV